MEKEIWKDVVGYGGFYQVSCFGQIRRFGSTGKDKVVRFLFQTTTHHGYKRTVLQKKGAIKNFFVHRIVAEAFIGKRKDFFEVNHINSIRDNNHASNLEYVTRSKNQKLVFQKTKRIFKKENWGFQVKIWIDGRHHCLGTFKEEETARNIYNETHLEWFGY